MLNWKNKGANMNGDLAAIISERSSYFEVFLDLYSGGYLDGDVAGIAAQLQAGKRELSERQIEVVCDVVKRFAESHKCKTCGCLEVDDIHAYLRSKLCSRHEYYYDSD